MRGHLVCLLKCANSLKKGEVYLFYLVFYCMLGDYEKSKSKQGLNVTELDKKQRIIRFPVGKVLGKKEKKGCAAHVSLLRKKKYCCR